MPPALSDIESSKASETGGASSPCRSLNSPIALNIGERRPFPRKDVSKMSDQSPANILIVDDEEDTLVMLQDYVSSMGNYKIVVMTSGKEALEKVEEISPDLILLDIMMDDMDGTEVCRTLKSNKNTSHIPVIAVTVLQQIPTKRYQDIIDSGVDGYVEKPLEYAVMKETIRKNLS